MESMIVAAGILGGSLILAVVIYVVGRLRIEQQRTLQALVERGVAGDELLRASGVTDPRSRDLRRGLLLIGVGIAWSAVTFFMGGRAWTLGAFPITVGLVYVAFRVLDGRSR